MGERLFDKKTVFFIIITLVFFIALLICIPIMVNKGYHSGSKADRWTAEDQRAFANKLKAEGLSDHAAQAYEEYLAMEGIDLTIRANTYYLLGESYMARGMYEDALAYFYKAEIADKAGDLKQDIGINVVTCLEKMGKSLDAQSALRERVDMDEEGKIHARGSVVARIGGRVITMGEVNDELALMPEWYQERYKGDAGKAEFIRQYVVNKLLLKKGLMLQYDKDPAVREQLVKAEENIIIQKVFRENVADKLKVDMMDLQNYYEAHKDEFTEDVDGEQITRPFEDVEEEVKQMFLGDKAEMRMKEFVGRLLEENEAAVYFEAPTENPTDLTETETMKAEADSGTTAGEVVDEKTNEQSEDGSQENEGEKS
ncbi:MAG: hypothetical protein JW938_07600 [Candidatus Omnitrophica bacterium]|nr:hypothetical protein [Candidatus Omnitrophota bacterium]